MDNAEGVVQKARLERFERIEKALKVIEKIQSNMKTERFNYFEGNTFGMKFSSKEVVERFNVVLETLIERDKAILLKEMEAI